MVSRRRSRARPRRRSLRRRGYRHWARRLVAERQIERRRPRLGAESGYFGRRATDRERRARRRGLRDERRVVVATTAEERKFSGRGRSAQRQVGHLLALAFRRPHWQIGDARGGR